MCVSPEGCGGSAKPALLPWGEGTPKGRDEGAPGRPPEPAPNAFLTRPYGAPSPPGEGMDFSFSPREKV